MSIRYPADLPITARREEIVGAIRGNQVLILAGETGSGKTTQLPKMCLEAAGEHARGVIGCTQPRRVAAMSVSRRVAEELGVTWGREVGCKMRFSDDTSRDTRVKFMTDGILLAEIQSDPLLRQYSMIILDEAHERSLNIDFLLGYLKGLLPRRPDLKVIVTSATIDTEAFAGHFGGAHSESGGKVHHSESDGHDDHSESDRYFAAPIIEVSGRLYPVEVRYRAVAEDDEEPHFIDAAVAAAEDALIETEAGDVLIFMPTERDIRETRDLLDGRLAGSRIEVLALFGRQSSAEQQRIFSPGAKRRVVIATNVAETSITIPRIRVVIDTGLARMSRYNPRTRTKRLPVEAVSQSSANQRAGRAGRVQDGVCIRLFEQEDFEKRAKFTMPEIQRANLAEVILRMKAHGLGEIEVFPFLNPPSHAAIRGGYELLHELGALNDLHELTGTGRELAKLPLDPSLGRMLLQARKEGCLEEMLIIASGLSVPDPRERPEEKREAANAAHKAFNTPDSDFLSLLKIWRAVPEGGGKNQLGKFCKANFLSFTRMQEWRDIWKQLRDSFPVSEVKAAAATDAAIHRCILAAHLGQIGMRIERNVYKAGGNREVMVFPGSVFYERREKNDKKGQEITKQPLWVVAGEIVQTSQLFARTLAKVDPEWIAELGAHLCDYKYSEPHWSAKAGRVLVTRRTLVHGLEVRRDKIDYGKIDAVGATQLFIRGALIEGENALTHRFYQNNQRIRQKIETTLTRVRSSRVHDVEEALFAFYDARIAEVSSIHDLNALIQEHGDQFLHLTEEDLTPGDDLGADLKLFPDEVALGNSVLPVSYHYKPGEEHDGVTVQVPLPVAEHLTTGQIQWMVPGLREELCRTLLRALPRAIRKQLMPIEPKAAEVAARFEPGRADFLPALAAYLKKTYRVEVAGSDWPVDCVPVHLQPRIEVVDQKQRTVVAARDLGAIQSAVKQTEVKSDAWEKLVPRFERYDLKGWTFGDVPEWIVVEHIGGAEVRGYPGLERDKDGLVNLRLFRRAEEAVRGTPAAVRRLAELALGKDIAWLAKELRGFAPVSAGPKAASFAGALHQLQTQVVAVKAAGVGLPEQAQEHVLAHLLRLEPVLPLTEKRFEGLLEKVRKELPLVTQRTRDLFKQVHEQRDQIARGANRYPGMEGDLARLVPGDLLLTTPHGQLPQVLRYLKAVRIRAERAGNNPAKDADKAQLIADWEGWETFVPAANREVFRWLMEEYRVQVFAQELGTAQAVSVKRLEALL